MEKINKKQNHDMSFLWVSLKIGIGAILYRGAIELLSYLIIPIVGILAFAAPENAVLYNSVTYLLSGIVSVLAFLIASVFLWISLRVGKHKNYQPTYWHFNITPYAPFLIMAAVSMNFAMSEINALMISLLSPNVSTDIFMTAGTEISALEIVLLILSTAVIPGIVEEIFFRGIILTNLSPYGRGMAIIGSAFLFGLMHMNPAQFFYTTLLGIVLGYIYVRTRSIWICILIHFTNNALGVLQQIFYQGNSTERATELMGTLMLSVMLVGLVSIGVLLIVRAAKRKKSPADVGSFGRIYAPDLSYEACPVSKNKKMLLFFSPSITVFTLFVLVSMITAAVTTLIFGLILGAFPGFFNELFAVSGL